MDVKKRYPSVNEKIRDKIQALLRGRPTPRAKTPSRSSPPPAARREKEPVIPLPKAKEPGEYLPEEMGKSAYDYMRAARERKYGKRKPKGNPLLE